MSIDLLHPTISGCQVGVPGQMTSKSGAIPAIIGCQVGVLGQMTSNLEPFLQSAASR